MRSGIISILFFAIHLYSAGLDSLSPVENWQQLAPGIWKAEIGNMDNELRYTDLAAEPPMINALESFTQTLFPFNDGEIGCYCSEDQMIMVRIPTDAEENIYGFGLQLDGIRKNKKVLTLNVDHWSRGGGRTHAPVPFYISSKGYGVFFNTARFLKAYVKVGNRKDSPNLPPRVDRNPAPGDEQPGPWQAVPEADAVEAMVRAEGLEVIVISGASLLDVVQRYNLYCGGGAMPPLWGLGFWHRVPAVFDEQQTRDEIEQFYKHDFPLDVIGLEPGWMSKSYPCTFEWQTKRFPDPKAFASDLLEQGIRLNLWENPYISPASRIYKDMYPLSASHLVWLGLVPDYTLKAARDLLTKQHEQDHTSIGISGYKIDEVDGYDRWLWPDHAQFPSGTPAETMRQAYGLIMQNMIYHDLFKKHNVRTYGLVRSSNGAASGYPFVIYSDSYNHEQYITGLSAASLSGILWTPEVRSGGDARDWLNRIQTVCFSPMVNLNAWASAKKPWSYGDVTDDVRNVINLRMQLLPYIYTAFADYHFKGIPPIRAMVLESSSPAGNVKQIKGKLDDTYDPYAETKVVESTDQFMFGPSILVAPFYTAHPVEREVVLPSGNWYDFYSGKLVGNGETITVNADSNRVPLFVKEGAVIPMLTEPVNNTRKAYGHPLQVRIYGSDSGVFDLYEDDGNSFDYQQGKYRIRRIRVEKSNVTEEVIWDNSPAMFGPVVSVW